MMKDKYEKAQSILNSAITWSSTVMRSLLDGETESQSSIGSSNDSEFSYLKT